MNPVYTFKCGNRQPNGAPDPHYHDRPGSADEAPPERVTCPTCGKTAARYYSKAPTIEYRGSGWTGAGRERR